MWVLILAIYFEGVTVHSTAGFVSAESCREAGRVALDLSRAKFEANASFVCVKQN